jgi:polysaccharide export outer membrane protein
MVSILGLVPEAVGSQVTNPQMQSYVTQSTSSQGSTSVYGSAQNLPNLTPQAQQSSKNTPPSNTSRDVAMSPFKPGESVGFNSNNIERMPDKAVAPGMPSTFLPAQMSATDKARLSEYRQMTDIEKAKVAEFCMMSDFEREQMEKYSRMTDIEKAGSPEYFKMSDVEKARVAEYSKLSDIEKARFARYCNVVDIEKARTSEYDEESDIERAISGPRSDDELFKPQPMTTKKLAQFGYNFFRPDSAGFSPLADIPVGDDYLVGPGDKIVLQLWGSIDGVYELEVNRSGEVLLPRAGAVKVWGVPFGELQALFREHLAKVFRNIQLNVNMGKLRLMKVYVVGEVTSPGDYNVSSLATVINALSAAGGPTKNGSLRNIQIRRLGKMVESVDLYDFFLRGDKSRDIRLQAGDTIYVPVISKVAAIGGNVRRPAIYELKGETTLTDLLILADGIKSTGYLQRVQVERVSAHDKKMVSDFNIDPKGTDKSFNEITDAIQIKNMDSVQIFPINSVLRDQVRLEGYVRRPGDYALKRGMRVKDLFEKDDILPETYTDVAVITRLIPPDYHPEKITINLGKALAGEEKFNIELREFDRIMVFSRWEMKEMPTVRINGEVQKPGEYRLLENMKLRDLIYDAGNLKKTAFLNNAEITRVMISKEGVKSLILNVDLDNAMKGNPDDNVLLQDMDEVVIRRIPDWAEETERYVTLSGEVRFPGTYPIIKGEKLSSVLRRAGGYTDKAYLKGAKFTRKIVAEIQQKRMDEIIARTERDLAQKQAELASVAASKEELEATKAALDGLTRTLERLKSTKAEGRVSIVLAPIDELQKTNYDLELMGGDTLNIPQSPGAVMVFGEVYNPTTVIQLPGEDVDYYLKKAGGPTSSADKSEMYVIRADGTVVSKQEKTGFLFFGGFNSMELDPGDTIVVPQQLERIAWMREIKDIASILGNLAITAGVVVAAGL